jgi:hypothetical protein
MTPSSAPIAAEPQKPGPTGPRTAEGKARCRLNAFRHGLTAQTFVLTAGEAPAYQKHHADVHAHYQPAGPVETSLTDEIAIGIWRLQRAHAIEEGMFASAASDSEAGHASSWLENAKAFDLLARYEGRIRRALDRDKAELDRLQAARKEHAAHAMHKAVNLYNVAKRQGKPYDPDIYFKTPPPVFESVFSADVVGIEAARREAAASIQTRISQLGRHQKAA